MTAGILLIALTGFFWSLVGALYSKASSDKAFFTVLFLGGLCFSAFAWAVACPVRAPFREIALVAAFILPSALLGQLGFYGMYRAMKYGSHGTAWCFSQAAMVFPFLAGWLWLGNPLAAAGMAGILMMIAALPLLAERGRTDKSVPHTFIGWCVAAFVLIGVSQVLTLIPTATPGISAAGLSWRVPLLSLGNLFWAIPMIRRRERPGRRTLILAGCYGLIVACGQIALYKAIDRMGEAGQSGSVYPGAIGSCILLFAAYCRIVRKERKSPGQILGLILLCVGIALLMLQSDAH